MCDNMVFRSKIVLQETFDFTTSKISDSRINLDRSLIEEVYILKVPLKKIPRLKKYLTTS